MGRLARLCAVALTAIPLAVSGLVTQAAVAAPSPVTNLAVVSTAVLDSSSPTSRLSASWTLPGDATGAFVCIGLSTEPPTECASASFGVVNVPAPASSTPLFFGGTTTPIVVMVTSYDAGGVTGPPATATLRATSQPFQKTTAFLIYGQKLTVSTRLTFADDGTPVAGQPIDLVACLVVANGCPLVAHLTTDSNGVASYVITATNTVNFRFVLTGVPGLGVSYGFKSLITRYGIVTHITKTTVRVGHLTYLWGRLTPKLTGARVYFWPQGYVSTRYVRVAYQKMPNGVWMTGYKISFKPTRKAKFVITAYKPPKKTATVFVGGARGKWFTVTAV